MVISIQERPDNLYVLVRWCNAHPSKLWMSNPRLFAIINFIMTHLRTVIEVLCKTIFHTNWQGQKDEFGGLSLGILVEIFWYLWYIYNLRQIWHVYIWCLTIQYFSKCTRKSARSYLLYRPCVFRFIPNLFYGEKYQFPGNSRHWLFHLVGQLLSSVKLPLQ